MSYSQILVPVDFSELSDSAIARAKEFKRVYDSAITLLHVIDYMPPAYLETQVTEIYASESVMIERAEKHMREIQEKSELTDAIVIVKVGRAREVVLDIQKEINADLVIMAKHSQRGVERILGSTTNAVASGASCDLLVVPE